MKTGARIAMSFVIALLLLCAITTANPEILAAHNAYRSEVGDDPLTYNTTLAASAQAWAEHDASIGSLVHSVPGGKYGENIAVWSTGWASWTDIVDLWASEKQYFIYGPFGNGSSTTGYWGDVGHYTQIVWNTTTQIGCGKATNDSQNADYFVCQYSPPGNYWGRYPYLQIVRVSDNIGVVRNNNTWLLDASGNGAYGAGDFAFTFGKAGDVYVTGDWDGDDTTEIGVVRNNNTWLLDASGNGAYGAGDLAYTFGKAGDVYVTGDWAGTGTTRIGVVRNNNTLLLDTSGNGAYGAGDLSYTFGKAGDVYITGDWDGDGTTEIGVVRNNNTWLLDASGNGAYGAGDLSYTFGKAGDKPVSGRWS